MGLLLDLYIHTQTRQQQPVELMVLGTETVMTGLQMEQGAIVQHLALIVTPDHIGHAPGLELADISGHQAVEKLNGIRTTDAVFFHGRQIHHTAGTANSKVLRGYLITNPGSLIAIPGHPILDRAVL